MIELIAFTQAMSVVSVAATVVRRTVLFLAVFAWAPLAYTNQREPMAPLPTIARSILQDKVRSTSLTAPLFRGILMPGVLIRTPVQAWNTDQPNALFRNLTADALIMGSVKTEWYNSIANPEVLVGSSHGLFLGCIFLTFSRLAWGSTLSAAIMLIALLVFMTVACHVNEAKPTPQAFAILVCLGFEFRKGFRQWNAAGDQKAEKVPKETDATKVKSTKSKKGSKKVD